MHKIIEPTHFIEQWTNGMYCNISHQVDICFLDEYLNRTKELGLQTVAIFKIKYHESSNN